MNEQERLVIQQWATAFLERSSLDAALKASAIALVPTIPTTKEGMPYRWDAVDSA